MLGLDLVDRIVDLLVHDRLELTFDLLSLVAVDDDLGAQADLELDGEVARLFEHVVEVHARMRHGLQAFALDRLLVRLANEVLTHLVAHLGAVLLLEHVRRDLARAEALHAGLRAHLLEAALDLFLELRLGDGETDLREAVARLFDVDFHGDGALRSGGQGARDAGRSDHATRVGEREPGDLTGWRRARPDPMPEPLIDQP